MRGALPRHAEALAAYLNADRIDLADLGRASVLAERAAAVERHLARVAARLPAQPAELLPASDASDAVILHLWQATQIVIPGRDRPVGSRGHGR